MARGGHRAGLKGREEKIKDREIAEQFHNGTGSVRSSEFNTLMRRYFAYHYPSHYELVGPNKELTITSERVSRFTPDT